MGKTVSGVSLVSDGVFLGSVSVLYRLMMSGYFSWMPVEILFLLPGWEHSYDNFLGSLLTRD